MPKSLVAVRVADAAGRERDVEVYVEDHETLQGSLLSRRFVPMRRHDESGKDLGIELIARHALLWVRLDLLTALDEIDLDAEGSPEARTVQVRVRFEQSPPVDGILRYLMPAGSRRLSDYLEALPGFFALRTPDHVYLIASDRVASVEPLAEVIG